MPKELTVIDTDNRDRYTTILKLSDGSTVEINPQFLFENVLENLGLDQAIKDLDKWVESYQI